MKTDTKNFDIQTVGTSDWKNGLLPPRIAAFLSLPSIAGAWGLCTLFGIDGLFAGTVLAVLVFCVALILGSAMTTIRRYRIKLSQIGEQLHNLDHDSRDGLLKLQSETCSIESKQAIWNRLADDITNYFSILLHNRNGRTGVLIWTNEKGRFEVFARGGGITTDARQFQVIPDDPNIGVIRRIKTYMNQNGVFVINCIKEAIGNGDWIPIQLEGYSCVQSLAVVPINAASEEEERPLLGLLMVTVDRKNIIHPIHVEHFKAMADRVATYLQVTSNADPYSSVPGNYVQVIQNMDFIKLFSDLKSGQTLLWLDTFWPGFDTQASCIVDAVRRGANIKMMVLNPGCQVARDRAEELSDSYGEERFHVDLERFLRVLKQCQAECGNLKGTLEVLLYSDLLGVPAYIVCDSSENPLYGYSSEYLGNATGDAFPHQVLGDNQKGQLRLLVDYFESKWERNNVQLTFSNFETE